MPNDLSSGARRFSLRKKKKKIVLVDGNEGPKLVQLNNHQIDLVKDNKEYPVGKNTLNQR